MKKRTLLIAQLGMFSALAYILTALGKLVPIAFNDFLRYDPKDAIIVIAGFALGPLSTIAISVVTAFLEMVTIGTTGIVGCLMNIISSVSFAFIPALFYKRKKSLGSAVLGLIIGSIITIILMLLWNYLITPLYMKVPREAIYDMLLPVFLPFNLIKCGLNASLTMLIYKPIISALRRVGVVKEREEAKKEENEDHENIIKRRKKTRLATAIISISVMVIMVILFIILKP